MNHCLIHYTFLMIPQQVHFPSPPPRPEDQPPPPEGESVYDHILPQSISYRPTQAKKPRDGADSMDPLDPPPAPDGVTVMPLVAFLRKGSLTQNAGWHRNAERRARGMFPVASLSSQLEPWERQLVSSQDHILFNVIIRLFL